MHHLLGEHIQTGDWKNEKHVPVIKAPENVKKGEVFDIELSIGDEISHPNTLEHHIQWIKAYFKPDDGKFPIEIGEVKFSAHGEGDIYTEYYGKIKTKVESSGTLYALSYCNIHGLWQSSIEIAAQ